MNPAVAGPGYTRASAHMELTMPLQLRSPLLGYLSVSGAIYPPASALWHVSDLAAQNDAVFLSIQIEPQCLVSTAMSEVSTEDSRVWRLGQVS